jgi:SAM-dependent methyltransferase
MTCKLQTSPDADLVVADHWSKVDRSQFSEAVFWLANPIVQERLQRKAVGDSDADHWVNFCVERFFGSPLPAERVLNIGCGAGELDRHLALLNAFRRLDSWDIAPGVLEIARREADAAGVEGVTYHQGNAELADLGQDTYDVILFVSSLHHVTRLETMLDACRRALRPGGYLIVNEYVGPNRFAFTPREVEIMRAAYGLIPARLRRSLIPQARGAIFEVPPLPDPAEVARVDPSESVRSEEIMPLLRERFDIVLQRDLGGTLLHWLLNGIAGNFSPEDPASLEVLEMLFKIEDALISSGEISSHFVLVVAAAKQ